MVSCLGSLLLQLGVSALAGEGGGGGPLPIHRFASMCSL